MQYIFIHHTTKNRTNRKRQLPFVCSNGNGKRKFVFLSWKTINSNQQRCPSIIYADISCDEVGPGISWDEVNALSLCL